MSTHLGSNICVSVSVSKKETRQREKNCMLSWKNNMLNSVQCRKYIKYLRILILEPVPTY